MYLSGKSTHGAGGLVSQWGSTIMLLRCKTNKKNKTPSMKTSYMIHSHPKLNLKSTGSFCPWINLLEVHYNVDPDWGRYLKRKDAQLIWLYLSKLFDTISFTVTGSVLLRLVFIPFNAETNGCVCFGLRLQLKLHSPISLSFCHFPR